MEPVGFVLADALDHIAQVGEGFYAVELAGSEQRVDQRSVPRAAIAAGEEVVLS